jgi:hypothetical protein
LGQNCRSAAVAALRSTFAKSLAANRARPKATRSRASSRFIACGTRGISTSWGRPVQAGTAPICSVLQPWMPAKVRVFIDRLAERFAEHRRRMEADSGR